MSDHAPVEPFAAWIERDVIHAQGADTVSFLQGQLSQDVAGLAPGASAWSLLLDPGGKTVAWLRATRVGEAEVVLDVDAGAGPAVLARLERFKLRTKCTLELRAAEPALAVRGVDPGEGLPVVWPGCPGRDLLGPSGAPPAGVPLLDRARYDEARIAAGVPAYGAEITPDTIPAETGQWLIDASVSFSKGCYTGQELVARIDSRGGHVPRPIRRLRLLDGGPAAVGDEVRSDAGAVVGKITSAAGAWALGPVGRAVEPGAEVTVAGRSAVVEP